MTLNELSHQPTEANENAISAQHNASIIHIMHIQGNLHSLFRNDQIHIPCLFKQTTVCRF